MKAEKSLLKASKWFEVDSDSQGQPVEIRKQWSDVPFRTNGRPDMQLYYEVARETLQVLLK